MNPLMLNFYSVIFFNLFGTELQVHPFSVSGNLMVDFGFLYGVSVVMIDDDGDGDGG